MPRQFQFNTYDECYHAGKADFNDDSRENAGNCRDRRAYDDGWHDARRANQSYDPLPEGRHGYTTNEKNIMRRGY
jgi:hypothetical protein